MKALYLRDKNKKRLDIRALAGDKLKHYNVTQGACSDGDLIYIAYEQKAKHGREHRIKIVIFDPTHRKIVKISKPLALGHANDMCCYGNYIYVTHSGTKKIVHKINKTTLGKCKDVAIKLPEGLRKKVTGFNGIATYEDGFMLRCMNCQYFAYFDKNFKYLSNAKFSKPFKDKQKEDAQGITYSKGTVYRAYSRLQSASKNYICKFKRNGKLVSKAKLETKGELENLFFIGGSLYGMIYRKKKKGGKKQYMSYIFKAK